MLTSVVRVCVGVSLTLTEFVTDPSSVDDADNVPAVLESVAECEKVSDCVSVAEAVGDFVGSDVRDSVIDR